MSIIKVDYGEVGGGEIKTIIKNISAPVGDTTVVFDELTDIEAVIYISPTYISYNAYAYKENGEYVYGKSQSSDNFIINSINGNEVSVHTWVAHNVKVVAIGS